MFCFFRVRTLRRAACLVPLFILLLAGCAGTPDTSRPSLAQHEAALRSRADAVADSAVLDQTTAPSRWWTLFADATLTALEAEAASTNLDLLEAAARLEESQAQLTLAGASRRPQLNGQAGYTRSALSENSPLVALGAPSAGADTWSLGLQASWELDLAGRLHHLEDASAARLQASHYDLESVRVTVAAQVARSYLLLRGVQQQQAITESNREVAEGLLRMAESRERNGVATRFDAASARAELAGIDAHRAELEHQRNGLMNALALLLGRSPRELDARLAAVALPGMPRQLPIGIPSELARQRPDILQAEARLRAAVADIGAAQADFYPRISLTGGLGVQAFDLSDLGSWGSRQYSIGPALYLPIFQGGRLEGNLALSEARQRQAAIAYQRTVLRAWHEVDDALSGYTSELKRHEQLQLAQDQNQAALSVAQRGYKQGSADFTEVLTAQRSLLASQAALNDSATASALSVVALYRALGGGWSSALHANDAVAGNGP